MSQKFHTYFNNPQIQYLSHLFLISGFAELSDTESNKIKELAKILDEKNQHESWEPPKITPETKDKAYEILDIISKITKKSSDYYLGDDFTSEFAIKVKNTLEKTDFIIAKEHYDIGNSFDNPNSRNYHSIAEDLRKYIKFLNTKAYPELQPYFDEQTESLTKLYKQLKNFETVQELKNLKEYDLPEQTEMLLIENQHSLLTLINEIGEDLFANTSAVYVGLDRGSDEHISFAKFLKEDEPDYISIKKSDYDPDYDDKRVTIISATYYGEPQQYFKKYFDKIGYKYIENENTHLNKERMTENKKEEIRATINELSPILISNCHPIYGNTEERYYDNVNFLDIAELAKLSFYKRDNFPAEFDLLVGKEKNRLNEQKRLKTIKKNTNNARNNARNHHLTHGN